MKIFTLAPNENWIVDRMVKEWNNGNSEIVAGDPYNCDVIWLLADWCWNQIPLFVLQNRKVVTTVHHIVPEKFDKNAHSSFMLRDGITDLYHCFNQRTADFIRSFTDKPIVVVPYWVNVDLWVKRQSDDRLKTREKFNLPKDAFVVGSFQRDTEGHDLKSPKIEKGPDLFCDAVEILASKREDIHVLLGGWRRQYVINRLNESKIKFTYVERPPIETIVDMYKTLDLYIVSARHEGGPQALLEAPAMNVPIISTPVGIAEDILAPESINENVINACPNTDVAYENVMKLVPENIFPQYRRMLTL